MAEGAVGIPPKENAEFVYHREDVLRVYTRSYSPRFPQLCLGGIGKHLVKDK